MAMAGWPMLDGDSGWYACRKITGGDRASRDAGELHEREMRH